MIESLMSSGVLLLVAVIGAAGTIIGRGQRTTNKKVGTLVEDMGIVKKGLTDLDTKVEGHNDIIKRISDRNDFEQKINQLVNDTLIHADTTSLVMFIEFEGSVTKDLVKDILNAGVYKVSANQICAFYEKHASRIRAKYSELPKKFVIKHSLKIKEEGARFKAELKEMVTQKIYNNRVDKLERKSINFLENQFTILIRYWNDRYLNSTKKIVFLGCDDINIKLYKYGLKDYNVDFHSGYNYDKADLLIIDPRRNEDLARKIIKKEKNVLLLTGMETEGFGAKAIQTPIDTKDLIKEIDKML